MRYLQYKLVLFCCCVAIPMGCALEDRETRLLNLARQRLIKREKEYLKTKPLSSELSAFISKYDKDAERGKREEKKSMYVVKNGNVVPLEEDANTGMDGMGETLKGNFTMVPLVIPIILEQNITDIPERLVQGDSGEYKEETSSVDYFALRTKDQPSTEEEAATRREEPPERFKFSALDSDGPAAPPPPEESRPVKVGGGNMDGLKTDLDNYQKTPNKVKKSRILDKILKDVEELADEQDLRQLKRAEGALCSLVGDWDSEAGGMQLNIEDVKNSVPTITLAPREPVADAGFLKTEGWTLTAQTPFNHSSLVLITAINNDEKKMAVFVGECRTCQESDSITGAWLMGRLSKDCQDQKAAHVLVDDVLRRNNVRTLQEEHLRQMTSAAAAAGGMDGVTGDTCAT